jgi:putative DNA primase/helicase
MSVKQNPETAPIKYPIDQDVIPDEIKAIPRWVVWKWKWGTNKWDKPPLQVDGSPASTTNPRHLTTFDRAMAAEKQYDGIGVALGDKGVGLICIDLDDCFVDDKVTAEAEAIVERFKTYTEYSPSNEGLKLWLRGTYDDSRWRIVKGNIEVYRAHRYLTVTGRPAYPYTLADAGPDFFEFMDEYMAKESTALGPAVPVENINQEEAKNLAIERCKRLDYEINNDGTMWLMKIMKICVLCGCEEDNARIVYLEVCDQHGVCNDFSADEIDRRYRDALDRNKHHFGSQLRQEVLERNDLAFARRVQRKAVGEIHYVEAWKSWVCWQENRFVRGPDLPLINLIAETCRELMLEAPADADEAKKHAAWCNQYLNRKGIDSIVRICRSLLSTGYETFNGRRDTFHCQNKVLVLGNTVTCEDHDPANRNTHISQVKYDQKATCPRWEQFISEVFVTAAKTPDTSLAEYVQKLFGYFLTTKTHDQALYIFHGDGANGKGVMIRVLGQLLGDYFTPASQDLFVAKTTLDALANLYTRRLAVGQETDADVSLKEHQVKSLTGDDVVECRRLYENLWSFLPTHKLILATNNRPTVKGSDKGIWRRIRLIPFRATFEVGSEPDLEKTLAAELPGILNWAIEGYKLMMLEGLNPPEVVETEGQNYREDMDSIRQWMDDRCELRAEAKTPRSMLYANYTDYCRDEGHWPKSNRQFYAYLDRAGLEGSKTEGTRYRRGIAIRSMGENTP